MAYYIWKLKTIALRKQENQHDLESNSDALKPVKQFPSTDFKVSGY